ncbi:class I SAM-dependent methyltransferase [Brevundimonas sp.]|uniref:class I SAM-dependent methyltransferase n=1 Tax=Brevundimonas sp. TaxID=1871086 RepID=UPI002486F2DC|nr:class I SAM-dependent methyltransferase [Brevundimonas sp.]MDI1282425.1 class I SAM-dependent methyltransferase [Brevundimonas sp.]
MSQAQLLLDACPLCAAASFRRLPAFVRDHIVRCEACGFNFSERIPTAEEYEAVYGEGYDYAAEDARQTEVNRANERAVANRLAPYLKLGRVVDVAAGAGRLLLQLGELGFEPHATEFNEERLRYLRSKGIKAHEGGLFPDLPAESFDVVIFTEVIEHINNPIPVLANIANLLRPGGALYVTTPNFDSLERRLLGQDWGMILFPEHITYWTPRHIDQAMKNVGLSRASLKAQGVSPFRILQALQKRGIGESLSAEAGSDRVQAAVAGNPGLVLAKKAVNGALIGLGLGSSIEAIYTK